MLELLNDLYEDLSVVHEMLSCSNYQGFSPLHEAVNMRLNTQDQKEKVPCF